MWTAAWIGGEERRREGVERGRRPADTSTMRTSASFLALLLLAGIVAATPASATYGAIVQLPAGAAYSPFAGPATVTFTFSPTDPSDVFRIRIRQSGQQAATKYKDYLVDPTTQTSPLNVSFAWKALTATKATTYVVDVRRQSGGPVITSESFTLLPALVSKLSASPSPFYPLVVDGFRDHSTLGFSLAADTADTVVHVSSANAYGRCCATEVRAEDLGPLATGAHAWIWDGKDGVGGAAPKGTYFVRISATDLSAVSMTSPGQEVDLGKGIIRRIATKQKLGNAFAGVPVQRATASGGSCVAERVVATHQASVLCVNAEIWIYWTWGLKAKDRIVSVHFAVRRGYYGCPWKRGHTATRSFLYVHAPPTIDCTIGAAKITYSYPYRA
jgi:hypothetical protein